MPVCARLSRRFYDVVGEDVTEQLVDWINAVEQELSDRAGLRAGLVSAPELLGWMFVFWITNFVGIAGLLIALRGH